MKTLCNSILSTMLLLAIGLLNGCNLLEKKEETPTPEPNPVNADTVAVKTGKGFTQLTIIPSLFDGTSGANGGFEDGISLFDMTVEPATNSLHFLVTSRIQTQQDPMNTARKYTLTLDQKQLTSGSDMELAAKYWYKGSQLNTPTSGFREGTAQVFSGSISCSNFGICTASLDNYSRTNTFASAPRMTPEGEVLEVGRTDNFASWAPTIGVRIFGAYQMADGTTLSMQSGWTAPNSKKSVGSIQFEPKGANNPSVWIFGASQEKLYVGEATMTNSTTTSISFVDSVELPADPTLYTIGKYFYLRSRPNTDRSRIGVMLNNQDTPVKTLTWSFNTATKKLEPNIQNMQIPNFGTETCDYDMDEMGNVYFDGWANNFQSDSTISLYKASGNTITSIGEDLLKSGSIKRVRYLNGKVYAAVVYAFRKNLTSPNAAKYHRVAVIRQE